MKKILLITPIIAIIFSLSSCVKKEDISINSVSNFSLKGTPPAHLIFSADIGNKSGQNLILQYLTIKLHYNGEILVDGKLRESVTIKRRSDTSLRPVLDLNFSDPFVVFTLMRIMQSEQDKITVSIEAKVRAGMGSKKIVYNNIPLSEIISNFGSDKNSILKSFSL